MKKAYLLLICIFGFISLNAKINKDSLRVAVEKMKPDTNKVLAYIDLGIYYRIRLSDSTVYYLHKGRDLSTSLGYNHGIALATLEEGLYYHNLKDYEKAVPYFYLGLQQIEENDNKRLRPYANLSLATSYKRMAKPDSAFYYYMKAERAFEAIGKPYQTWQVYFGIGNLYLANGEFFKAKEYLELAYELVKNKNNRIDIGYVLFHLGEAYFVNKDYDKYRQIVEDWAAFDAKKKKKDIDPSSPAHSIYFSFFSKNDSLSILWLENSVEYFKNEKDTIGLSWGYQNLAFHYKRVQRLEDAYITYGKAVALMKNNKEHGSLISVYGELYKLAKEEKNYAEALVFLENYQHYRDSLQSEAMQARLQELEVRYETEKKEQQLKVQELTLTQTTMQRNVLLGSSVFIGILALMIIFGYRSRMRTNGQIAAQRMEIQGQQILQLQQEKRLLAFSSMIEGQESERLRIAGDLHDGIGSLLTTIKAHLGALEPISNNSQTAIYTKANNLIDETCTEVRRIAHNMMPKMLLIAGLRETIEDLMVHLQANGLTCNLEIVGDLEELTKHQAVTIYRIIQELSQNIVKHAEASSVLVQLINKDGELSIIMEDDGKGFDLKRALEKKSLGLKSISSRVEVLQGKLDIDTVLNEGTTVIIQIPLKDK